MASSLEKSIWAIVPIISSHFIGLIPVPGLFATRSSLVKISPSRISLAATMLFLAIDLAVQQAMDTFIDVAFVASEYETDLDNPEDALASAGFGTDEDYGDYGYDS